MSLAYRSAVLSLLLLATPVVAEPTAAVSPPAVAPPAQASPDPVLGQKVPEFTAQLLDPSVDPPKTSDFDSRKVDKITAYIFIGTHCPATLAYIDRFKGIEREFSAKGVQVVYLYPNREDGRDIQLVFHRAQKFSGQFIGDDGARLAKLFKASRTSELFLTDKQGTIVYHGAVDDNRDEAKVAKHYLADAINEVLASKPVTVPFSQVFA